MIDLSVVIPALEEAANLENLICISMSPFFPCCATQLAFNPPYF
jgi:hypothetical protein